METNEKTLNSKPQYYCIDLMKFICALLVVTLHIVTYAFSEMAVDGAPPTGHDNVLMLTLMPLYFVVVRLAVPFFFIASSYFLFKKVKETPEKRGEYVKKYCLRIFLLYVFWFVVSLPITIDKYFIAENGGGAIKLLVKILLQGGYSGSWYLIASIWSVLLVNLFSKYSVSFNIVFASILYAISCLFCTYFNVFSLLPNKSIFLAVKDFNANYPIYLTFFNGYIFVLLGRLFAERETLLSKGASTVLLIVCPLLMFCELFVCTYFSLNVATDCFLTLVPMSVALFQTIKSVQLKPRKIYGHLRKYSTFLYLYHFVFLYVFYRLVYAFRWKIFISNIPMTIVVYLIIVASAILLCELNCYLSKKKAFRFIKYGM